jgi:hypothetical protein
MIVTAPKILPMRNLALLCCSALLLLETFCSQDQNNHTHARMASERVTSLLTPA